jgi:hypothetical protein
MIIDRRGGAPSTCTRLVGLLGLTLWGACAAMTTACSASSGTAQDGWGFSGGGPLGGGSGSGSGSGGGDDASTSTPVDGDATAPTDPAEAGSDTGAAGDDASLGAVSDGASPGDAPGEAATGVPPDFTLLDTAITGIVQGSPVAGFDPIREGAAINLAQVGTALSIRANTVPALVGSVAFALDAKYTHTENTTPYTLCSDDGKGTVTSCATILTVGKHTLTATPYSAAGLAGDAGAPITLDFTVVDVATDGGADSGIADAAGQ